MNLIVLSRLPGTGKSPLDEAAARDLHIPVFAKDWSEWSIWGG